MSKLKRRKTAADELKSEQQFKARNRKESLRIAHAALQPLPECSSAGGRSSCWTSSALCEVEKLWMKTLQVLCPQSSSQDSEDLRVPAFPQLSTEKKEGRSGQCLCDLDEDVIPFPIPDPVPGSASFSSSPDPRHRDGCVPIHHTPSSLSQGNRHADGPQCEWDGNGSSTRNSGLGSERSETVCEREAGTRTVGTSGIKPRATAGLGITSESGAEIGHRVQTSGSGSGSDGIRLECCPMCLSSFPARFSQMECDSHLAQCLSEMNVDVVW
ncbi:uncharacterized protein si:ch73-70k4.1 [Silurus meridionalis]|uniref:UBZ2-type domain-containing protein n=1 Tax=Silurus meridionalis TaxID=175797 RepID=A0A8T0ATK6_SILME|nr:uncharacterized protein si:ch73-70k4.1 [Silurus meridionalis]KAF7695738.1 hypothetical protein HF521_007461 [Silurus meridionalis]